MKLRRYTSDDYCAGTPCVHYWRGKAETVFPYYLSGAHPFDGSRYLAYRCANGYRTGQNIDGCDLTTSLFAMIGGN